MQTDLFHLQARIGTQAPHKKTPPGMTPGDVFQHFPQSITARSKQVAD